MLHKRIDPAVELLRQKPQNLKTKRIEKYKSTNDQPPIGAPSWCLNEEALKRFNRPTNNIPVYDYDTAEESDNNNHNDIEDDNEEGNGPNSNKRKKKNQKKSKKRRHKSKKD